MQEMSHLDIFSRANKLSTGARNGRTSVGKFAQRRRKFRGRSTRHAAHDTHDACPSITRVQTLAQSTLLRSRACSATPTALMWRVLCVASR